MVYTSDLHGARMNIPGIDRLARFGCFINLRKTVLFSTVFPGNCVKLSTYLDKSLFTSQLSRIIKRFSNCTVHNASFHSYSRRQRKAFVLKTKQFSVDKRMSSTLKLTLIMSIVQLMKQSILQF